MEPGHPCAPYPVAKAVPRSGSWFFKTARTDTHQDVLFFSCVAEGKSGEPTTDPSTPERRHNRLHFDIRVSEEHHAEVVAQLIARGATKLWDGRQGPHTWVTMADPEGNEFCVA